MTEPGGGVSWGGSNGTLTGSTFTNNYATYGGGVFWGYFQRRSINGFMDNCNFKNNQAVEGINVYWQWTVNDFLQKYGQINDYDYVYILNDIGTPNSTIVLNKKGITITSQGNVVFDAKGGNVHFEVTGDNVLIEKITFQNFNFAGNGGTILWIGKYGILKNCNFMNNTGSYGGAIRWTGPNGNIIDSTFINNTSEGSGGAIDMYGSNCIMSGSAFINNTAKRNYGGVSWHGPNGSISGCIFTGNSASNAGGGMGMGGYSVNCTITNSTFINNKGAVGGGMELVEPNCTLTYCIFISNHASARGGGIYWNGINGTLTNSIFINNSATNYGGGGVYWNHDNGSITDSIFTNNTATHGGAIRWYAAGSMANCTFVNSKSEELNGIYADKNLNINGGSGIVYIYANNILSGISIVVLNNETYYYPPGTNINFC